MTGEISLARLDPDDPITGQRWDDYVEQHDEGTFFHYSGWQRVLARAFGHKGEYIYAVIEDAIVGLVPLCAVSSVLFGKHLASTPFCVYGGILADNSRVEHALRKAACDRADDLQVDDLELRSSRPSEHAWPTKSLYYTFRKELNSQHNDNLLAIPNRQRAMLRKGLAEGLFGEEVGGAEGVNRLYRVYSESVRNLGTPVFSRRFLHELRREFGEKCRVLMICQTTDASPLAGTDNAALMVPPPEGEHSGQDVAGVMSFYYKDQVLPYYGGSTTQARHIKGANHFLYWDLMRRSVDEGCGVFDFGRSKADSGPFAFKKNLGFEPEPLHYEYYLVRGDKVPELNPNNPKYQQLIAAWRKLPLPVANLVGPPIAKYLG